MSTAERSDQDAAVEQDGTRTQLALRDNALEVILSEVFGAVVCPELNNFDGDTQQKWRLTSLATGPGIKGFDDTVGQVLNVKYFYVHTVAMDGPTKGEYTNAVRVVLIDPELNCWAFVSDGIAKDLARMVRTFGLQPWKPPIAVQVTKTKAKIGYYYGLAPAT